MMMRIYTDTPEASKKSRNLSIVTSWPLMISLYLPLWLALLAVIFGHELNMKYALLSCIPLCFAFWLMRKRAWRRLDEQARKEAELNRLRGQAYIDEKFREMGEELLAEQKKKERQEAILGFVLFSGLGLLLCGLVLYFLPLNPINTGSILGSELQTGKAYYIENLYIIDSYAKVKDGWRTFYFALFQDKDGKNYFISFDPGANSYDFLKSSRLNTLIDEYIKDNSAEIGSLKIPVYVEMHSVKSKNEIYYRRAYEKYLLLNAEVLDMNAEYICMGNESAILHSLSGNMMLLAVGGFFVWLGWLFGREIMKKKE